MEEAKITTKNYSEDFNLFYEKKLQNLEDTRVLELEKWGCLRILNGLKS